MAKIRGNQYQNEDWQRLVDHAWNHVLLGAGSGILLLVDQAGMVLRANREAAIASGVAEERLAGQCAWDVVPCGESSMLRSAWGNIADSMEPASIEAITGEEALAYRVERIPVDEHCDDVFLLSAKAVGYSPREEVRGGDERFRVLFTDAADAMAIQNLGHGRFIEVNEEAIRRWGYSRSELLEMTPADLDAVCDEEEIARRIERIAKEGQLRFETIHRCKDGTLVDTEVVAQIVEYAGGSCVLAVGRDISDRKRAEASLRESEHRYRTLLRIAPDAIFVGDAQTGVILDANSRAEELVGRKRSELIGIHQSELHPADQADHYSRLYRESVDSPGRRFFNLCVLRADGEEIPVEISSGGSVHLSGKDIHLAVFRDISERVRASEKARRLAEQLRQSQKLEALGHLASGIAHDFNNLLTAVVGYTQHIRKVAGDLTEVQHAVDGIREVVDQGAGMARSLLTFSCKTPGHKVPVELRTLMARAVKLLRCMLPAAIEIETDPAGKSPVWVYADENQLQQVLMNLAVNARRAIVRRGRLWINVSEVGEQTADDLGGEAELDHRHLAQIVVGDNGCGMTPEVKDRMFDPFFTSSHEEGCSGLGLAIVHGIVKEHNGWIDVESSPGVGTSFTITLPAMKPETREQHSESCSATVNVVSGLALVAGRSWNIRSMISTVLNDCGFDIMEAVDGPSINRIMRKHCSELRLLVVNDDLLTHDDDAEMNRIVDSSLLIPTIVMVGNCGNPASVEAADHVAIIRKPFMVSELQKQAVSLVARSNGGA